MDGPISAEVMSIKAADMVAEARKLAKLHANIVIKVPMTEEGLKATKTLASEDIKVNMTLIFSAAQALLAAKAGARYISPFVGRLDDVGQDGMKLIAEIMNILDNYDFDTEVIVASVRDPIHVVRGRPARGSHRHHPLRRPEEDVPAPSDRHAGIKKFQDDWAKVPKK